MRNYLYPILLCLSLHSLALEKVMDELVDFSYAGYACGEKEVPLVTNKKYSYFNIEDFGAIPNDGKSDRDAFLATLAAMKKAGGGVLYCPEGNFELSGEEPGTESIVIDFAPFILKGAGREKSILSMSQPQLPKNPEQMWTSPPLIHIKAPPIKPHVTSITKDAKLGARLISLESTEHIKKGDWIRLSLLSLNEELLKEELGVYYDEVMKSNWKIAKEGVRIESIHQVKRVTGKRVELATPLLYPIKADLGWQLRLQAHLEEIGIEDITFRGDCLPDFVHHRSWNDDGGYKPLVISNAVNSWFRRVNFEHVSEALTYNQSAHVSVYDVCIFGKRGHSAVRAQGGSTRVLIAKVVDSSDSYKQKGAGQWHAVGVSSCAIGTVLWRNKWGLDAGFESHASQPRITLFDACEGGMLQGHQGGAKMNLPNHMKGLVFWNFKATSAPNNKSWTWWEKGDRWSKFLPPLIVGFHGKRITFSPSDIVAEISPNQPVKPESLYEAQLRKRLGKVPSWLTELKKSQ